eukprot:m.251653 g.251653  ORF g.251653 m.251653 type:complete len:60 (-) comp33900_c1_seq1:121-300(-)
MSCFAYANAPTPKKITPTHPTDIRNASRRSLIPSALPSNAMMPEISNHSIKTVSAFQFF